MSALLLVPLAAGDNRALTIALFLVVVAITLGITFWASRQNKTAADYYAGGRGLCGPDNWDGCRHHRVHLCPADPAPDAQSE